MKELEEVPSSKQGQLKGLIDSMTSFGPIELQAFLPPQICAFT